MSYGSLGNSKATPANFHLKAAHVNGGGFARNAAAAALNVGRMAVQSVGALGKSLVGRDDFTQQVARQAKY